MEKRKRWHFWLIVAVIALTLYNILPTVFYYTKPLKEPVDAAGGRAVAAQIADRVNGMEQDAIAWLQSYSKLLKLDLQSVETQPGDPRLLKLTFANGNDAATMTRLLPSASQLIPFVPAQLSVSTLRQGQAPNEVYVVRNVGVRLENADLDKLFHYTAKSEGTGSPTALWRDIVNDRALVLMLALGGPSREASQMAAVVEDGDSAIQDDIVVAVAKEIGDTASLVNNFPAFKERWYRHIAQGRGKLSGAELVSRFKNRVETLKVKIGAQREALQRQMDKEIEEGAIVAADQQQTLQLYDNQLKAIDKLNKTFAAEESLLTLAKGSLTPQRARRLLEASQQTFDKNEGVQRVSLDGTHPLIEALVIDWNNDAIELAFYGDIQKLRDAAVTGDVEEYQRERINQIIFNDIARASTISDETIAPNGDGFAVALNSLPDSRSVLTLDLGAVALMRSGQLLDQLRATWQPRSGDLSRDAYPLYNYEAWKKLPAEQQRLGLVVYAPGTQPEAAPEGFSNDSLYVIARGYDAIAQKYRDNPNAEGAKAFLGDFENLKAMLSQYGFIGFAGSAYGIDPAFKRDYIFRLDDYYSNLVAATREDFAVKGSKRFAVLDFTDLEQRILARNRIWDKEQEDLLKWKEEYEAAQVDLDRSKRYLIPAPTKNVYWQNAKISAAKYFGGDDRKVLKWGLDLSGGKTVRIGLRDASNKPVTNPEDLKQAVNELYTRVNKMGVSERTIRIENENIVLEFPGSQGLSASELVKASAMYFHIVNEKFTPYNSAIGSAVNGFLQDVWNEAVVTNRKDAESINEIARKHLGQDSDDEYGVQPRSAHAKVLWEAGLRLAGAEAQPSTNFDDSVSTIGVLRGDDYSQWYGQTHPLIVMFKNYALEGSSLNNIIVSWDQNEGNVLNFSVKGSYEGNRSGNPRDDFFGWTTQFAEDRIVGTAKEAYSQGRGWRMAVVLNDRVITMPALRAALRDNGSISGRFTQREINQLAADLKAGSLSFTPRILSEQNVSPELGVEERQRGIMASLVALVLVFVSMIGYYRFGGLVASVAVLFNILIMWGVLQNLDAALTLPGIAGIVLTMGMAIDANVLVFERIREEFKISGRIASAIQTGYRKAFTAIVDSNVTTIIAALILLQFDSGPIKAFAVTLIIGIVSSMFTALFMTRWYFAGWVKNPKNTELKMSQFVHDTNIDFLGQAKKAIAVSLLVIVAGGVLFFAQYRTIFGMDFTGGYALTVEVQENAGPEYNYRLAAGNALLDAGATNNDVDVRQLTHPWQLRIQLGMGIEEKGHPFYQLPHELEGSFDYPYQSNPRLVWIVDAMQKGGLSFSETQLQQLDRHWSVVSGQFSETMRDNAIMALTFALLAILVYITLRFEFKYAIAAVVALLNDLLITLGIIAFLDLMGLTVQIDLEVIGALMTIIGYSLNDKIIVFDRIREDVKLMRKSSFTQVINHSINVTLSRTLMTSGTTFIVLLALVLLGGPSIFGFSLVMAIGVVVGTLSSWYVGPWALLYFHEREQRAIAAEEGRLRINHN